MSNLKEMSHKELINDLFINMMRSYPFMDILEV